MKQNTVIAMIMLACASAQEISKPVVQAPQPIQVEENANRKSVSYNTEEIISNLRVEIQKQMSNVSNLVSNAVKQHPELSCEITKAALDETKEKPEYTREIIESACLACPEQMRTIAQCAIAVYPDCLQTVQTILAKLDPGTGDSGASGKEVSAKNGMDKNVIPPKEGLGNPLDTPPTTTIVPFIHIDPATNGKRSIYGK